VSGGAAEKGCFGDAPMPEKGETVRKGWNGTGGGVEPRKGAGRREEKKKPKGGRGGGGGQGKTGFFLY